MTQVEVAVIGAGAAGLGAAAMLAAAGSEVLLLEARDRIGGRARTDLLGSGRAARPPAARVLPARGRPGRSVACPSPQHGVSPWSWTCAIAPFWRKDSRWRQRPIRQRCGLLEAAGSDSGRPARSGGAVLPAQSRPIIMPGRWSAPGSAASTSTRSTPGGYGRLVERFGTGLPIRCGCPVTSVRTLAAGVRAVIPAGKLRAQRAVVTVPLGVLAAGAIAFDPPLAPAVLAALDALPMGNLVKLRVRLAGDPLGCGDMIYATASPSSERAVLWLVRPFGRAELMGFAGGSLGRELAGLSPRGSGRGDPGRACRAGGQRCGGCGSRLSARRLGCGCLGARQLCHRPSRRIRRAGSLAGALVGAGPLHRRGRGGRRLAWHGGRSPAQWHRGSLPHHSRGSGRPSSALFAPRAPHRSDLGSGE